MLKNKIYYSVSSNKKMSEIEMTETNLSIVDKLDTTIVNEKLFEIADQEYRNNYLFVYVKKIPNRQDVQRKSILTTQQPQFSVFVFYTSENGENIFSLQENIFYPSVQIAKNANLAIQFENKYFETWYSGEVFLKFTQYPDVSSADKATLQTVVDDWSSEIKKSISKLQNTNRGDVYGGKLSSDNLTKALIKNHLNPVASITDLDKKLAEYDIKIPFIPIINKRRDLPLKSKGDDSKDMIIDAPPVKNN